MADRLTPNTKFIATLVQWTAIAGFCLWLGFSVAQIKYDNDKAHASIMVILQHNQEQLKKAWTITDMAMLYANRQYWLNNTNATFAERLEIINNIHKSNN